MADAPTAGAARYASVAEVRADVERAGGDASALCGFGRCFCVKAAPGLSPLVEVNPQSGPGVANETGRSCISGGQLFNRWRVPTSLGAAWPDPKNATPIPPNNAVATRNKWRVTIAHPLPANAQVDRGTGQWFAVPPS